MQFMLSFIGGLNPSTPNKTGTGSRRESKIIQKSESQGCLSRFCLETARRPELPLAASVDIVRRAMTHNATMTSMAKVVPDQNMETEFCFDGLQTRNAWHFDFSMSSSGATVRIQNAVFEIARAQNETHVFEFANRHSNR